MELKTRYIAFLLLLIMLVYQGAIAQYTNIRVSNPASTSANEVSIAIDPTNPSNLVAGANLRFIYRSTNGGQSWTESQMSSTAFNVWGDPCVAYDVSGNLYFGHLSNPPSPGYWIDRIIVQKSTNGGLTWNGGVGVGFNPPVRQQDKEWIAVDMTNSPHRNNIYMCWTEFDKYGSTNPLDSSRIRFSRSTDAGLTWSTPLKVSDVSGDCIDKDNTTEGAVPAVGPNGEIYTAWSGPLGIMFDKSTDGGLTFGQDIFVTSQPGGWDYSVPGIYRANGLPVTVCDTSNSPYRGNIYVNWTDQRNGTNNTDVFLIRSTDGGNTWGGVKRVNDDITTTHQFFTWMNIDQSTGNLWFVFYDRRNSTGTATDVYVARSTDGGETFTNFKVSQTSFTPTASIFFGDYTNIAAMNGKIYPIWMRMDGTALSIWTAIITDTTTVAVAEEPPVVSDFKLEQNYPNPFNPSTTIRFELPPPRAGEPAIRRVTLEVYDLLGRVADVLVDADLAPGVHSAVFSIEGIEQSATGVREPGKRSFASGMYLYRLKAGEYSQTRRMILSK